MSGPATRARSAALFVSEFLDRGQDQIPAEMPADRGKDGSRRYARDLTAERDVFRREFADGNGFDREPRRLRNLRELASRVDVDYGLCVGGARLDLRSLLRERRTTEPAGQNEFEHHEAIEDRASVIDEDAQFAAWGKHPPDLAKRPGQIRHMCRTPLEYTTSNELSGKGMASASPWTTSGLRPKKPRCFFVRSTFSAVMSMPR